MTNPRGSREGYTGVYLDPALKQALTEIANAIGTNLSDYIRTILTAAVYGTDANIAGAHQSFELARSFAMNLAKNALREAFANMPQSVEEAAARGLLQPE